VEFVADRGEGRIGVAFTTEAPGSAPGNLPLRMLFLLLTDNSVARQAAVQSLDSSKRFNADDVLAADQACWPYP
jgi:hypothetical protein